MKDKVLDKYLKIVEALADILLADRDERKREVAVRTRAIELAVHDLNGTALRGSNQAWPGDRCTVEWMLGRARAELATEQAEGPQQEV